MKSLTKLLIGATVLAGTAAVAVAILKKHQGCKCLSECCCDDDCCCDDECNCEDCCCEAECNDDTCDDTADQCCNDNSCNQNNL